MCGERAIEEVCRGGGEWIRWIQVGHREIAQCVEGGADLRVEFGCVERGMVEEEVVEEPMGAPDVKRSRRGGGVKRVCVLEWMVEMADCWRADEVNDARCGGGGASGE